MTVEFQDCATTVARFIGDTRHKLTVAVCWFTHPLLFAALFNALQRGVRLRLAINHHQVNFNPSGLNFIGLERLGAEVIAYPSPGLLHHKMALADDRMVLTGSFNWTKAEQRDHVMVMDNPKLAEQFEMAVSQLRTLCKPLELLRQIPPRQISFQQLYHPVAWMSIDLRRRIASGAKSWLICLQNEQEWLNATLDQRHYLMIKPRLPSFCSATTWDATHFTERVGQSGLSANGQKLLYRYGLRVQQGDVFIAILPNQTLLGAGIVASELGVVDGRCSRFIQWIPAAKTGQPIRIE